MAELNTDKEPITTTTPATKEFRHVLRPFMKYSAKYKKGLGYITVNYTLDNYVSIFGDFGNKSGYLIDPSEITNIVATGNSITSLQYKGKSIEGEILKEKVAYKNLASDTNYTVKELQYVYNTEGKKTYIDGSTTFIISDKGVKTPLTSVSEINEICKYTKVSALNNDSNKKESYTEYYQVLNPGLKGQWFTKDLSTGQLVSSTPSGVNSQIKDYSSVNYYVEAYAFSNWVNNNLGSIKTTDRVDEEGNDYYISEDKNGASYYTSGTGYEIFKNANHPSPEASNHEEANFTKHRREVIEETIKNNLNQAIVNYGKTNPELFDFKMPQLSTQEWQQIENNVSIITFLQGVHIGTKYYNNYAIASTTNNKDFVSTNDMIFVGNDEYYHKLYCNNISSSVTSSNIKAYRNSDFTVRRTQRYDKEYYYYAHTHSTSYNPPDADNYAQMACYYCIIDRANYIATTDTTKKDMWDKAYYTAIGRERYVQRKTQI